MSLDPEFAQRLRSSTEKLFNLLDVFDQGKVLAIGDMRLDEFLYGKVKDFSQEAPVLVLRHEETQRTLGAAANTVYNLALLGAQVKAVGLIGRDERGKAMRNLLKTNLVNTDGLLNDESRPTFTETRILGYSQPFMRQQIVRIDRKSDDLPKPDSQLNLAEYIKEQMNSVDVVVCCDYGEGTLTRPVISAALEAPRVVIKVHEHLERYRGANYFILSKSEAEKIIGYKLTDQETLNQTGKDLLALTQAKYILINCWKEGMNIFERNQQSQYIPPFNWDEVLDIAGADDTLTATLSLALAVGASIWEAAILANLATSTVVRQFGKTRITHEEMKMGLKILVE
ncbi:MAG: bifunctional ADP-heptose synthase [Cyanobacteria bacterium P01_A01_bin.84]